MSQPEISNAAPPAANGAATTSLVTGLVGLLGLVIFFVTTAGAWLLTVACLFGLLGLVFGIIGLRRRQSKGMSITGLILGCIVIIAAIAILLFALIFVGALVVGLSS